MCLAGLSTFLGTAAFAQDTSHYYGGLSVGQSKTQTDAAGLTSGLLPGVGVLNSTTDEKDTAYKLFGGYQFNRNIALEGGYFDLGKNSFNANTVPAGTLAGGSRVHGLNLDLVGTLPFTERFSALARVGMQHAWSKSTASGTGAAGGALAPGVLHTHSGQGRETLGEGQGAHQVQVQAVHPGPAGQRAGGHGVGVEAVFAQVEVAAFQGDVAVELVAAKQLVGRVFFVRRAVEYAHARQQARGQARRIGLGLGLAHRQAAVVVAGVLCERCSAQEGAEAGQAHEPKGGAQGRTAGGKGHGDLSEVRRRDALRKVHRLGFRPAVLTRRCVAEHVVCGLHTGPCALPHSRVQR